MKLWDKLNALIAPLLPHDKPVRWTLVIFLILLIVAFATTCRRAEAADLMIEAGSTYARGPTPVLGFVVATPGPLDTSLEAGFHLIGSSTYNGQFQSNQIAVHGAIVDGFGKLDIGLGLAVLQNEDAYNSGTIQFMPMLRYRFTDRLALVIARHFSNAGTSRKVCNGEPGCVGKSNLGRDLAAISWRF